MSFSEKYKEVISCIDDEFYLFDKYFKEKLVTENKDFEKILSVFYTKKGKRIRSALMFLFAKAIGVNVDSQYFEMAFATEMVHNATLVHDDIIDCSFLRRECATINAKYDNKLAVLSGDYLLSLALNALSSINSYKITKIYTASISKIINGEIEQYFENGKMPLIEAYVVKSQKKTAELFKAGLCSVCVLADKEEFMETACNFALNFGTAFQIKNDLEDIEEDLKNQTFTAPVIFFAQDTNFEDIKNSEAIQKTNDLINLYINRAIENISSLEDNQYKQAIFNLCKMYFV